MQNNNLQQMLGGVSASAIGPQVAQQLQPQHHQVYEYLRQGLMQLHQQGVPGMDKILNALNSTHVGLMRPPAGKSYGNIDPGTYSNLQNRMPNVPAPLQMRQGGSY